MDDYTELKTDIKEIKAKVDLIAETMLRNTVSLELHEKRTTLAETRMDRIEANSKWLLGLLTSAVGGILLKLLLK